MVVAFHWRQNLIFYAFIHKPYSVYFGFSVFIIVKIKTHKRKKIFVYSYAIRSFFPFER